MIVLHGWWSVERDPPGELTLWAEDSGSPPQPPARRGRRPARQPHPFALAADALAAAVGADGKAGTAVLVLPTEARGPQASAELLRARAAPAAPGSTVEGRWEVPTLGLDPAAALDRLLERGADPEADVVRPTAGADLRVLQALAEFSVDLVGRGRVLPAVRDAGDGRGAAVWSAVVTGADAVWLRAVAAGLPGCFLAALPADVDRGAAALAVVGAATDALVDAAVRSRLGPVPRRRPAATFRSALAGPDPYFASTPVALAALDEALAAWQREVTEGGAVRACFRLVEPEGSGAAAAGEAAAEEVSAAGWRVDFALQSTEEPSLVVDAGQVWRAQGGMRALARHVAAPQETLLGELGRAVRLYPEIDGALRTARPSSLSLDVEGAHLFLSEVAPILLAAGFGVLLPGWWTNPAMRVGAKLSVSTPAQPGSAEAKAVIGRDGLVEFRWDLAVGEHTLTEQEIADLVEAQQPLVRVRGQWMYVDADRLARARAFLAKRSHGSGRMSVGGVLAAIGSVDDGPGGLPVVDVEAQGWLADLLSGQVDHRIAPMAASEGFTGVLRPYQERGLAWLSFLESVGLGGVLADDMGLGKTVQLLALVCGDPVADSGPTLLVCPMSLVGNWQREAARFAPGLRVHLHHGAERPKGKAFHAAVAGSDLVVTTYGLVIRDIDTLREMSWRRVVLDEAQAVKNAATRGAIAVRSLPPSHRFAVTGTPVENRLGDLWSLMEFANPGLLGQPSSFKQRFATPIERHGDAEAATRLRTLTQPFVLRRLKTDTSIITDLPAKIEMEVVCSLTREQASLYQAVVADMMERIESSDGIERRGLVLATMTKLKQVCNHPAQFLKDGSRLGGRSGKLARVEETLDEVLASGEKALLFTQYAEFGEMLRTHLGARFGREVAFLHGGLGKAQRDALVARFQDPAGGGPGLFVLSLKAGGTGLTLTAANHVIHVDRWWNPAVEDQATDRAFRIGQTRAVQVRKLVCAGTLEEKIATMIKDKRGLAARVVGTGEGWLTELSTAALRELFKLEAGSVPE
ncbi:MAG TPA: DEAD/DEAH box helicase [Mycobacteriales bacterium]|nr:DEAD/DEAH box helicase [Mycobacteriales bacterium]